MKIKVSLGQVAQKCCLSLMSFGCPQGETERAVELVQELREQGTASSCRDAMLSVSLSSGVHFPILCRDNL